MNKYTYARIIQQNHGYGWEDVDEVDKDNNERYLLKEYRMMGYPTRAITRRILNEQEAKQ
jgi:hypothetical protein